MKQAILDYLNLHPNGATPTEIGMALGKQYGQASSSVNHSLKILVSAGVVDKIRDKGVKYRLNKKFCKKQTPTK